MTEINNYGKGIVSSLRQSIDNDEPLSEILYDNNFCGSGYKCYYGGVIPPYVTKDEMANNFVISVLSQVDQPSKHNKPTVTKMNTDSFFIILSDIKDDKNIKVNFLFYDGIEAIKNIKKAKSPIREFNIDDIEKERRKPWGKINFNQISNMHQDLQNIFQEFSKKVKEKQLENAKHTEHSDNCECGEIHDSAECTGNNESSE